MGFLSGLIGKRGELGKCVCCGKSIDGIRNSNDESIESAITPCVKVNSGEYICETCLNEKGIKLRKAKTMESKELLSFFSECNFSFSPTQSIEGVTCVFDNLPQKRNFPAVEIDENNGLIKFFYPFGVVGQYKISIRKISELIDFELMDDTSQSISGNSLLGAGVGLAAAGPLGAIIGAGVPSKTIKNDKCSRLVMKVIFNDLERPEEYIYFIANTGGMGKNMKCNSPGFKQISIIAQKCISIFKILLSKNNSKQNEGSNDVLQAIEKLASLKNMGVLTEDEFQAKKTELLSRL